MFNVSKKTLSVVLCLALLLSVVAVCFMTPATAKTVTSSELVSTYKDLSKEFTPDVSLTFEGDETTKYGIAYGRWSDGAGYSGGKLSLTSGDYWVFFGKDGSVGKTIVRTDSGGKGTAEEKAAAVANRYTVTTGKTYMLTFDLQGAKDSTVPAKIGEIGVNISVDGNAPAANNGNITILAKHNTILEYKIGGVAQAAGTKLTNDSDCQTVSYIFQAKVDGACGINPKLGANMHIDNVKIVELDKQWDSSFQNKITFDLGGWEVNRTASAGYATEENGNKYGVINVTKGGTTFFSSGEYRTNGISSLFNYHLDQKDKDGNVTQTAAQGLEKIAEAYSKMYKFLPGKKYEISFKYRYDKDQTYEDDQAAYKPVVGKTNLGLRLMADPGGASCGNVDILQASGDSWAKDVVTSGLVLKNDPATGLWQDCKVTFTVKTLAEVNEAGYTQVRANTDGAYDFDGAYFGIRSDNRKIHIDDYEVKEITSEPVSITTDYVSHDMTGITFNTSAGGKANGTVVVNGSTSGSVIVNDGDEHGDYIKTVNRATFTDAGVFELGKKYYVSFDAKSGTGSEQTLWLSLANLVYSGNVTSGSLSKPRYNFHGDSTCPFKLYINGEQVTSMTNFAKLGAEWKHYGIVIDFTDKAIVDYVTAKQDKDKKAGAPDIFDDPKYIFVGVSGGTSYLDNFTIVSTSDVEGAVPETEKADFSYVSKTYESTSASKIAKSATASLSEGVVSVTSGRFTFADSGIITAGHKYTFSFDAKLSSGEAYLTMIVSYLSSAGDAPRYFINNGTDGSAANSSTNTAVRSAFKFYIVNENGEKVETALKDYKVTDTWQKFIVEFDYTDAAFLAATEVEFKTSNPAYMGQLTKDVNYFYVGANNGQFKNFKIIEHTPGIDVEGSIRKPQVKDEEYLSAGLRFRAALPKDVADNAAEIGFVAAPSTHASVTADWYKLEKGLNPIARQGVVKNTALDKNYIYATDGDTTYYQMVITGLSAQDGTNLEAKTAYNRRFSVVLYIKDAEGKYSYYALGESSYYHTFGNNSILKAQ